MTLPLLLSVPHSGARIPPEVPHHCQLNEAEVIHDGDEGAAKIYDLGADSLDTAELVLELEEEFDIKLPNDVAKRIETVGQSIAIIERIAIYPGAGRTRIDRALNFVAWALATPFADSIVWSPGDARFSAAAGRT